jgi:aspartyl-tRNA(Asn)/glutamyl-tRNA(Gln) amidotransferase subunit C
MQFTEQDLDTLSRLARIDIAASEKQKMLHDMQAILGYVSELNEVQGGVTPEEEQLYNIVRDDVVTHAPGAKSDALLREAPSSKDGYVEVMQVLK